MDVLDKEQWFDSGIQIDDLDFEFEVVVATITPRFLTCAKISQLS